MQTDYPSIKCLHPVRIRDPRTRNKYMFVPCNKCAACMVRRSEHWTQRCQIEESKHQFTYFVTLTYSNEYLPLCRIRTSHIQTLVENLCSRTKNKYGVEREPAFKKGIYTRNEILINNKGLKELVNKCQYSIKGIENYKGTSILPYASHTDINLFLKRLRKNLSKYSDEKIRYYLVSEYGPQTYRPHYHLCIYFDEKDTQRYFIHCLRKSWTLGNIDASLSRGSVASYVASYVNSSVTLPKIYDCLPLRPFCLHSSFFSQTLSSCSAKEVYEKGFDFFNKQCFQIGNKYRLMPVWRSYTSYFFPKCREYNSATHLQRLERYTLLSASIKHYQETEITSLSAYITEDITSSCPSTLPSFLHYWYNVYQNLLLQTENEYISYKYDTHVFKISPSLRLCNIIQSALYLSKHFTETLCKNLSPSYVLRQIEEYYINVEKFLLSSWYENMSDYMDNPSHLPKDICLFYDYNKDLCKQFYDVDSEELFRYFMIEQTTAYRAFSDTVHIEQEYKVKHKYLNDLNEILIKNCNS